MSKYNQLALTSMPLFYMAAPTLTDQSGSSSIVISGNTFEASGQPIIYGNSNSFNVGNTNSITLDSDVVFQIGSIFEFVILANSIDSEVGVYVTDIDSGVFITQNSVLLRVTVLDGEINNTQVVEIPIEDWDKKLYCRVFIGGTQASLVVNEKTASVTFTGTPQTGSSAVLGTNVPAGYNFLIDGIGIYFNKIENKSSVLDDPGSGHSAYASIMHAGHTTKFSTFLSGGVKKIGIADFYEALIDSISKCYLYTHMIPVTDVDSKYLVVRTNNDWVNVEYDVSGGNVIEFTKKTAIQLTDSNAVVNFRIPIDAPSDFSMDIETILDASIYSSTPASLAPSGNPIFPSVFDESIVNCPSGIDLEMGSYEGTWIDFDVATPESPKTIELVFKPIDPTQTVVIFKSSDGTVSTASQSGYSMYLNGVSVSNLDDLRWGQWNHLALVKSNAAATSFTLNTDGTSDPMKINYQLITSYPTVLTSQQIANLYAILAGADVISFTDLPLDLDESEFDNGLPFQTYSLAWSIIGAGGNQ